MDQAGCSGQQNEKQMQPPPYTTSQTELPMVSPMAQAPQPYPQGQGYPQAQGYPQPQYNYGQPPPPPQPVTYVTQTTNSSGTYANMQAAIPVMPMWAAITLCIVNILLPGIGTIIASFSVFCCANIGQSGGGKVGTFCLNFWVGWLQLCTIWIFLIGWIWAIMWGVAFITVASQYGKTAETVVTTTTTVMSPDGHQQYQQQQQHQQFQQQPAYPAVGYSNEQKVAVN